MKRKLWNELTELGKYRRLRQIIDENSNFGKINTAIDIEIMLSEYEESRKEEELDRIANNLRSQYGYSLRWYDLLD